MKLPNAEDVIIDDRKLWGYILSFEHPVGRYKAAFFAELGFHADRWETLDSEIRRLIRDHEAEVAQRTVYGQKYVVRGRVVGAEGRSEKVVTVWIVRAGEQRPRFITLYPED